MDKTQQVYKQVAYLHTPKQRELNSGTILLVYISYKGDLQSNNFGWIILKRDDNFPKQMPENRNVFLASPAKTRSNLRDLHR